LVELTESQEVGMSRVYLILFASSVAALANAGPAFAADVAAPGLDTIAINDNRLAAGSLEGTTLTVRLEAREGKWFPDSNADPGTNVLAFGVDGGPLEIPGPVIRVVEGTEVRAFVRNRLEKESLFIHGLYTRPGGSNAPDAITIEAGQVREIRFQAGAPGTYYYWGATNNAALARRQPRDSQLYGAFLVEPRGAAPRTERVLLVGVWANVDENLVPGTLNRMVINGKSWPHTERLTYQVGEPVHIRVLNVGAAVHPMHLHGFYFKVDSRGNEQADAIFPTASSPRLVNTERVAPGRTFSLTWTPTRPGNWLFHCHDMSHVAAALPLDGSARPTHQHVANHALEMMAGPVVGITVVGKDASSSASTDNKRRNLRLVAKVDEGGTPTEPAYGFALQEGTNRTPAAPLYLPSPTIVLKRGEPVTISVVNELPEATAVHWHGIELESYYDGVAGFSGSPTRLSPAIAPGQSFDARFTPPRSGTFIYHTHVDEMRQQQAGLNGALLVVDNPAAYDPTHDIVLLVSVPRREADGDFVFINGSTKPAALNMKVGDRYRLRFINIHVYRPSMRMRLLRENTLLTWRGVAKDGMDLPPDQSITGPAEIQMGNGETYDFEFSPTAPGDIRLDITNAGGVLLTTMPVHVRR
jgi:FtsP/CotA-like multicopper oxidase with cupredoxin domain